MKEPSTRRLRVSSLSVDRRVQRALDPSRAQKIADKLDLAALGELVVSQRRDGTLHIVDGQTRVNALMRCGLDDLLVKCAVHEGLTLAEEAALFRLHNDTKQVRPVDKFLVRAMEREPKAVDMLATLKRHGWKVTGATSRGHFTAVSALEWVHDGAGIFEDGNGAACNTVIEVLTAAYGLNADGVRNELVRGLGIVVLHFGDKLDLAKLADGLAVHDGGPLGVVGAARQLRNLRGESAANAMAEVLVGVVNKGRRSRRLQWRGTA